MLIPRDLAVRNRNEIRIFPIEWMTNTVGHVLYLEESLGKPSEKKASFFWAMS